MPGWVLFVLLSVALAAQGGCDFADSLSDNAFNALITKIKAQPFTPDKVKILAGFAANNTLGFSSNQTVQLIQQFSFTDDRVQAIKTISSFILTLECRGVAAILKSIPFSGQRLETLRVIIELANEADLKAYSQLIIDTFDFGIDKTAARDIIAKSKPRSCLFGPANIPLFAFIIDVSGSMSERFKVKTKFPF